MIKASAPLAEVTRYAAQLGSITQGQGSYTMEFSHYDVVPASPAADRARRRSRRTRRSDLKWRASRRRPHDDVNIVRLTPRRSPFFRWQVTPPYVILTPPVNFHCHLEQLMTRLLMALAAIVLCVPAAFAADALPEGNWRFSQNLGATESPLALVKVEKKDDKLSLSVLEAVNKAGVKTSDLKVDGKTVTFNVEIGGGKYTFEGMIDAKDAKVVRGSFGDGTRLFRGSLNAQEGEKIEPATAPKLPDEMAQARRLNVTASQLGFKARQSKDANDKAELLAKAKEAQKEADEKSPGLYREVVTKHADSPFAVDAANNLLRIAGKIKPKAEDVATWVKIVQADAAKYGPKIERETTLQVGETLVGQKDVAASALPLAEKVAASVKDTDPLASQSRALKLLATAEKAAGKTNAATETRLAKVEKALDDEYVKKVPPFKPEKFAGRKDKEANRVAVMELFTGATCPPCVAADAAFDALEMAYEPKDLVLIQYHMHIPGPDTLTNPATIARWEYYSEKSPEDLAAFRRACSTATRRPAAVAAWPMRKTSSTSTGRSSTNCSRRSRSSRSPARPSVPARRSLSKPSLTARRSRAPTSRSVCFWSRRR